MARATIHLRVLPMTRGECVGGARPCPLVTCRHHLLTHVYGQAVQPASDGGPGVPIRGKANVRFMADFDEQDPDSIATALTAMAETCALDVADRAGGDGWRDMGAALPLEEVGRLLGIASKDKVLTIQRTALEKVAVLLADEHPDDPYFRLELLHAEKPGRGT